MMADDHAATLHRIVELWAEGRPEDAGPMIDPELEIHTPFSRLAGEPYRGLDGYRRWLADIAEQFDAWVFRFDELRPVGPERTFIVGAVTVRGRGSGVELVQPAAGWADFRDGRVLALHIHLDEAEALAAAGLEG